MEPMVGHPCPPFFLSRSLLSFHPYQLFPEIVESCANGNLEHSNEGCADLLTLELPNLVEVT